MSALPMNPGTSAREPRSVYLYPGDLYASAEPSVVSTILGSCIAVCLWDPVLHHGGLNHFLLPHRIRMAEPSNRFAEPALANLIQKLERLGSTPTNLVAKVFGGACVMREMPEDGRHLGADNADAAYEGLARVGIRVVGGQVGGSRGRRLMFSTFDGAAWVKEL